MTVYNLEGVANKVTEADISVGFPLYILLDCQSHFPNALLHRHANN